jgi:hypothetical protein
MNWKWNNKRLVSHKAIAEIQERGGKSLNGGSNYWLKRRGYGKTQKELGMVVHTCNPSTKETKVGRSQVQGQPELHSEFKYMLGYRARL